MPGARLPPPFACLVPAVIQDCARVRLLPPEIGVRLLSASGGPCVCCPVRGRGVWTCPALLVAWDGGQHETGFQVSLEQLTSL